MITTKRDHAAFQMGMELKQIKEYREDTEKYLRYIFMHKGAAYTREYIEAVLPEIYTDMKGVEWAEGHGDDDEGCI